MSILKNYVADAEEGKYSTPDKPQQRIKVGDKHFTYYGSDCPEVNSFCEFEMKESKAGNAYIGNWRYINEDGTTPSEVDALAKQVSNITHMTTTTPAQHQVPTFKPVDQSLSIMTQSAFKALMENASDNIEHDVILDYASLSVRVAKGWDKALKAYQLGGDPRDALEQQKQEEQQATPEPEPFDDQIPF